MVLNGLANHSLLLDCQINIERDILIDAKPFWECCKPFLEHWLPKPGIVALCLTYLVFS
jgi:hypothetical protein